MTEIQSVKSMSTKSEKTKPVDCCICFDLLGEEEALPCGHYMHISCIKKQFSPTCAVCRAKLPFEVEGKRPDSMEEYYESVNMLRPATRRFGESGPRWQTIIRVRVDPDYGPYDIRRTIERLRVSVPELGEVYESFGDGEEAVEISYSDMIREEYE